MSVREGPPSHGATHAFSPPLDSPVPSCRPSLSSRLPAARPAPCPADQPTREPPPRPPVGAPGAAPARAAPAAAPRSTADWARSSTVGSARSPTLPLAPVPATRWARPAADPACPWPASNQAVAPAAACVCNSNGSARHCPAASTPVDPCSRVRPAPPTPPTRPVPCWEPSAPTAKMPAPAAAPVCPDPTTPWSGGAARSHDPISAGALLVARPFVSPIRGALPPGSRAPPCARRRRVSWRR